MSVSTGWRIIIVTAVVVYAFTGFYVWRVGQSNQREGEEGASR